MVKNPFGGGFRPARPKSPFALPKRPTNPFGTATKPKVFQPAKPTNRGQSAANQEKAEEALRSATCLSFTYDALPRLVEVHTIGITRADRPALNGWQVGGRSDEGPVPDWRTFCFDECFDVQVSDIRSGAPRPGYRPGAKQFKRILAEL